ncbi:Os03g0102300 [Oryza sativa Japonica Group]|uniref:Os03g0102300 protein n=1 Tax=Oryza sativa subsp. japonica TaxID=39947 RepID=Q0DW13_ORYSJ|nr:Os03g0102300 [Oryza sativa Japonica Group]|eukprot:NP_001048661.2 Os03g0102300 [Oryza sativa Japonica Group]
MISEISATEVRLLLLQAAADSNLDSVRRRLCQLVDSGLDGCILLLQVCLDQVLLKPHQLDKSKHDLLSAVFRYCMDKTYFTTCFCEALGPMPATHGDGFLKTLSNVLELSPAERVGIGLALSDSEDSGLKLKGQQFSIAQIEGLCLNLLQSPSNDQIHDIVIFLHQTDGLSKHMDTFNTIISLFKTKETPFFAPTPFNKCDIQSRHLDMCFGSMDYDSELLLSEIEKEITMADIVTELGYGCTVDTTHCKEILSIFEPLDDVAVSKLVGAVIGTHNVLVEAHNTYAMFVSAISNMNDSPQLTTWNTDVLVDSINELAPSTNWVHVMENLDHEGFNVPDEAAFCLLMSIYAHPCKEPFPLHAVCGSLWTNTEGQISFLKHAVSVPTDTFTFSHCSRKLAFPDLACPIQDNHAWFCLDLMVVLCQLAEVGHTVSVQSMLEYPLQHCPELLIVGLGHVNTAYNLLQYEVQSRVFPAILKDATKSNVVNYLWQINPSLTLRGFVDAHSDPDCLLRIVDVCRDLKILSAVLDSTPYAFSIKLAVAASRIDHSHLEKWLIAKLRVCKDDFLQILQYQSGHLLSNQKLDELRKSYISYELRNHDSVVRGIPTSDNVEIEADAYFHQMFSGQISIAAIVQMLSRFKNSPEKREQLIFKCMISNMFEEYKFLPKYPDKQLKLSALLFGSLIKHRLVTHLELGIALHAVLDALHKSVDSKMFMFGTTALEQFMDRLIEWPDYCNHILQISHLCGAHTEMVSAIERALARISSSQNELSVNISVSSEQHVTGLAPIEPIERGEWARPRLVVVYGSSFFALAADFHDMTSITHPHHHSPSHRLLINHLHYLPLINCPVCHLLCMLLFFHILKVPAQAKAKECIEVLPECYYPWFAQSMVMKRASIEPKFHDLYLKFFVKVNSRFLNKEVLKATYENCKILLRSDLIKSSSEERSLLKNLGSWLGKFTIGRNQALLAKEIDPKVLIVEAYEKGLMIAVIPFTSKVLFKNLDVDLKDVNPTSLLKDRVCEVEGNPDFSNKDVAASQTQISSGISRSTNHVELQSVISSTSHAYATPHLPSNSMVEDDNVAFMMPKHVSSHTLTQVSPSETALASQSPFSLTQLVKLIPHDEIRCKISSKLGSLGRQLQYSKIMDTALDKAIKEILCPVVEKSVGTAIQNTKKLILKDYALESDNNTIKSSVHSIARTIAGNLAYANCKEPLCVALTDHLQSQIQTLTSNNKTIKQLIDVLINDNLDLGCRIIKSVAMCKAIEMIDEEITESFPLQKKQREAAGSAYCDAFTHAQGRFAHEPEALHPKHEHLSVAQQVTMFMYGRAIANMLTLHVLVSLELAVKHSLVPNQIVATGGVSQKSSQQLKISYFPIDSFSKLVAMVLKYSSAETGPNKCSLLPKILLVAVRIIQRDSEEKKASFNPRPYFRLFISLLYDLISSDLHSDGANFQVLIAFANAFHALQPLRIPSWSFCDMIPSSCIQMRNVILDAHPQDMRVVDPASPNLKIDLLPEISMAPQIMSDVEGALKSKLMKTEVDEYFKKSEGSLFLSDLKQKLLLPQNETSVAGTRYNVPLINSLVLYVGIQGLQQQQTESSASGPAIHTAHMDIFRTLMADLDTEGRYLVLNAIANQLRYPNIHTHCFYFIILHLFSEATQEIIQDQIMRVILERLVVRRPHPWGLQMTLVELIKNPRYKLWSRPFIRCGPQIDKVLIEFVDMLDDPRLTSLYSSFRSIN